ncbi:MAG: acetylglutamate kinase [Bacteroidota bacterium]
MVLCPRKSGFLALHDRLRMLWEQHAAWTLMTIISIADGLADEELVTQRLLRNPADIAAVFRPLYGDEIAGRLNSLLTAHLVLAAQLVKEVKAGDNAAAAATERRWYANGDEIAAFLSSINPYWSREEMAAMWRRHLDLVKGQAVSRLNRDYAAQIAFYDRGNSCSSKWRTNSRQA